MITVFIVLAVVLFGGLVVLPAVQYRRWAESTLKDATSCREARDDQRFTLVCFIVMVIFMSFYLLKTGITSVFLGLLLPTVILNVLPLV